MNEVIIERQPRVGSPLIDLAFALASVLQFLALSFAATAFGATCVLFEGGGS